MRYALYPNKLKTGDSKSYIGKIKTQDSINLEGIIDNMCRPGSGINKAQAVGSITEFFSVIEGALRQGYRVNLPLFKIAPSLRGVFTDYDDKFDANRHTLSFNISKGEILKELSKDVKLSKTMPQSKSPYINRIIDVKTQESLGELQANMVLEVRGLRLRLPDDDDNTGIFMIDESDTVHQMRIISKENQSKVLIILPDTIPEGKLRLKLVAKQANHTQYLSCTYDLRT